jgi:hypothetical protein
MKKAILGGLFMFNLSEASKDYKKEIKERAEAEANYMIADYEVNEAYDAYIECLRAE